MSALSAPLPWTRLFCGSPTRSCARGCCTTGSHRATLSGATTEYHISSSSPASLINLGWIDNLDEALKLAESRVACGVHPRRSSKERSRFQKTATSQTIRHPGRKLSRTPQLSAKPDKVRRGHRLKATLSRSHGRATWACHVTPSAAAFEMA